MTFPYWEKLCCPSTGEVLEEFEPWLWSNASGTALYPEFCQTPVIHADPDSFLIREALAVTRSMAEFGAEEDSQQWLLKRYGRINAPDPTVVDTEVLGEGYPGFWDLKGWPASVEALTRKSPEQIILQWLAGQTFGNALDLGCGQGGMTYQMAQQTEWVFGVEYHFYLAALANRLLRAKDISVGVHNPVRGWVTQELSKKSIQNAWVLCAAIEALPFSPVSFDWIHCGHVLDLVPNPHDCLEKITKLLRPKGILSICSPWDFPVAGHFDRTLEMLSTRFHTLEEEKDVPWVRPQHQRRFLLHQDWLWLGQCIS